MDVMTALAVSLPTPGAYAPDANRGIAAPLAEGEIASTQRVDPIQHLLPNPKFVVGTQLVVAVTRQKG